MKHLVCALAFLVGGPAATAEVMATTNDLEVLVEVDSKALASWSGISDASHEVILANGFKLGIRVAPAPANVYERAASLPALSGRPLFAITLSDLSAPGHRRLTTTYGPSCSAHGYGPRGGADTVVETGEPGVVVHLLASACAPLR